MNIQFQICGLSILLLILIFYKSHKTLQLYKEKFFYVALCIMIVSLSGDILSLVAIHYREKLPLFLVNFICKTYVVSLIWGTLSALIYVYTDIIPEVRHKVLTRRLIVFTALESLLIYLLPLYIYVNGQAVYTYGPSVIGVYIFVLLYILYTLTVTIMYRKRINPRIRAAIVLWMVIWMVCAGIQFLNSALLIVGFASAIGVLILFVIMENPEANLERRLGCFNAYALTEYLNQMFERKKIFSVMEISFDNTGLLEEKGMDVNGILCEILHVLDRYDDILTFKSINLSLVLISAKREELEKAWNAILEKFAKDDVFQKVVMVVLTDQTDSISNLDKLFRFLSFVRAECSEQKGKLNIADANMVARYEERDRVEQDISDALAEDRVEIFLQPIFSNNEKGFTSAEALVRIRKRDGGFLSPEIFIPVAEESGQILELGERVLEKVCQFLQDTEVTKLGVHYIEVNLSVIQCEKMGLSDRLISIIERYGIDPTLINLEITETASISARKVLLENMKRLIEYGFTFSLDDFGKGESNLMYVVEMPVSIVKLDQDMSKAFFCSEKARHAVRTMINMAHDMEMKVVSEGIETKEEMETLKAEGIDYIQGYYYSKPLPVDEYLEFLRKQ